MPCAPPCPHRIVGAYVLAWLPRPGVLDKSHF
jgi:hypothetical protein